MKLQVLAANLFKLKWLTASESDDAKLQYKEFVDWYCSKHEEKFATFYKSADALDPFLNEFLHKN